MKKFLVIFFIAIIFISVNGFSEDGVETSTELPLTEILSRTKSSMSASCSDLSLDLHAYYAKNTEWFTTRCVKVRPVLSSQTESLGTSTRIMFGLSLPTGYNTYYTVHLQLFCTPRSLVDKQVLSAYRSCEKDPKPECFAEPYLNYLSKVKPTEFVNDVLQACSNLK